MKCKINVDMGIKNTLQIWTTVDGNQVIGKSPGNLLVVWGQPTKIIWISSNLIQNLDQLLFGGSNPDPYPSTGRLCEVLLDLLVPFSGFGFLL